MFYVGGAAGMRNRGAYAAGTQYLPNDMVQWQGSTYLATATTVGNAPSNMALWVRLFGTASNPVYSLTATTASPTATTMTFDGQPATVIGSPNVPVVPSLATSVFELKISARRTTGSAIQGWIFAGMIARDGLGTRLIGSVTQLATWSNNQVGTVTVTVNTAGNYLDVQVQTSTSTQAFWQGTLTVNEMIASS